LCFRPVDETVDRPMRRACDALPERLKLNPTVDDISVGGGGHRRPSNFWTGLKNYGESHRVAGDDFHRGQLLEILMIERMNFEEAERHLDQTVQQLGVAGPALALLWTYKEPTRFRVFTSVPARLGEDAEDAFLARVLHELTDTPLAPGAQFTDRFDGRLSKEMISAYPASSLIVYRGRGFNYGWVLEAGMPFQHQLLDAVRELVVEWSNRRHRGQLVWAEDELVVT
jgi:hypothetical protein